MHRRFDVARLPRICVQLPAVPCGIDTQTEMYFSPICPEVLERIAEGDAPYETAVLDATDGQVQAWAVRAVTRCAVSIGGVRLSWNTISAVRQTISRAVNDPARPVLQVLADVSYALAAMDWDQDLTAFEIPEQPDRSVFCGFLSRSVWSHDATILVRNLWDYRRFVLDLPVHDQSDMAGLVVPLPQWEAPYRAQRYFTVFSSGAQMMSFFYGSIVRAFALSCRYMAGLCGALNRPADVPVVQAALGASEYLHRQLERAMPAEALPWFDPEST